MSVEKTINQIKANKTMTENQTNNRALATVRTIDALEPIEGADNIEMARVGGWKVVVGKGIHNVGDKVVYFEIDSLLPLEPEFSFLKESNIKELPDGTRGYRLKTIKLKGQVSQGLVLPINDGINIIKRNVKKSCRQSIDEDEIVDDNQDRESIKEFSDDLIDDLVNIGSMPIGRDLTDDLGVRKYEVATTSGGGSGRKSSFPHFIPKTDEERIQNLSKEIPKWIFKEIPFYITEKLDGTSATFYYKDGHFGVCSRNQEVEESEDSFLWQAATKYSIKEKLENYGKNIAIQGELLGPKIQDNHYKLNDLTLRFFNVFDIDNQDHYDYTSMIEALNNYLQLPIVPIIAEPPYGLENFVENTYLDAEYYHTLSHDYGQADNYKQKISYEATEELIDFAQEKSQLNNSKPREGVVFRSIDGKTSFKVINNNYLLKTDK
jgi:hypothetical protein